MAKLSEFYSCPDPLSGSVIKVHSLWFALRVTAMQLYAPSPIIPAQCAFEWSSEIGI